jgi:hypothetical protein
MHPAHVFLSLVLAGLAALPAAIGIAWAYDRPPAPSARFVRASIHLDGREILRGSTSDDGSPDVDAVWGYLKGLEFQVTEELQKLALPTDGSELVLEKKGEPNAIVLAVAYGGEARTWRLSLSRVLASDGTPCWKLRPTEIERLFPYRLISRAEAARLREPTRSR